MSDAPKSDVMRAEEVTKSYRTAERSLPVLNGINLSVAEGEFLAILGQSGAGKSTLLHILGALDRPTGGKVFHRGEDMFALSNNGLCRLRTRTFGFVFQFYHLLADFNALENVMLPSLIGRNGGQGKERRARGAELLARVGLQDRIKHRPFQLSGGERQRVAIARALMNDPDVLFFDEPTGNLDTRTGEEIHSLIKQLHQEEGKTIILVTHETELAQKAQRIVHIVDGRIVNGGVAKDKKETIE